MIRSLIPVLLAACACAAEPAPDPAAMQAAFAKMSTPVAEHAVLAKQVGEWDVRSSMWMAPGAPPEVMQDSATFTAIHDGRWIRQDYRGQRMGKAYTGLGLNGFDTTEGRYVATWTDSMSTAMSQLVGTSKDGGKTIEYTGAMEHCPMTGGRVAMRGVLAFESADKVVFTMYMAPAGQPESKGMELVYTRKK